MSARHRTVLAATIGCGLILGLLPATTTAAAPVAPAAPPRISTIDKTKAMPAADRAAIDAAAQTFLTESLDKAPAVWLAVWDPRKGYYEHAYGTAVLPSTPATTADHVMIGSITKTVFATAVLEQVAAKRLRLTDTVRALDPALAARFPKVGRYTVSQLLGMRTRIPDYADAAVAIEVADPTHRFTRDELIALAFAEGKPLPSAGGYSTTNYLVLGSILQKLTGKSPESLVNGVFAQARMTQSRLPIVSRPLPPPASHGYVGELAAAQFAAVSPSLKPTTDVSAWTFDWGKEGGGAWSTIGDLATWGGICLGNRLLPKGVAAKRLVFSTIDAGEYGRGIIRQGDWLSHEGQALGYEANVACNPVTGAVVAWAVNSTYGSMMLNDTIGPVAYPEYYAATQAQPRSNSATKASRSVPCAQAWQIIADERDPLAANSVAAWGRVTSGFLSLSDESFDGPLSNAFGDVAAAADAVATALTDTGTASRASFDQAVGALGTVCAQLVVTKHSRSVPRFVRFTYQTGVMSGLSPAATERANATIARTVTRSVPHGRDLNAGPCMGGQRACGYFVQTLKQRACTPGMVCVLSEAGLLPVGANDGADSITTMAFDAISGRKVPLTRVVPASRVPAFLTDVNAAVQAKLAAGGLANDPYFDTPVKLKDVRSWLPQPDGIHVWFDKYAVAPGSFGVVEVVVPPQV